MTMGLMSCNPDACGLYNPDTPSSKPPHEQEVIYDETGCLYTTAEGLVMAGYQGWFNAEGDGAGRGWNHYCTPDRKFEPGHCTIDFWPDVSEYEKVYETAFRFSDGRPASVFSPYDYSTVDLHFKWLADYGIDGIFLQRFVTTVKDAKGLAHVDRVLENALRASEKYQKAFCLMYDLSGAKSEDMALLLKDWDTIVRKYELFDNKKHPTYLRHNGKPLLAVWGVGFSDGRKYSVDDVYRLVRQLKSSDSPVSIMLGVPYYWRSNTRDAVNEPLLHEVIRESDVIMDWGMGRYKFTNMEQVILRDKDLKADIEWCRDNDVLYMPHIYPGGSVGNLKNDPAGYDNNPRMGGCFIWKQAAIAKKCGAKSLYVGMFDEVDEGTQIFKCLGEEQVPLNLPEQGKKFVGYEKGLPSDHYLWLTGEITRWIHNEKSYTDEMPVRK